MLKFPNLIGFSPHLTTGSVLDILLVSFVIYQFLLLVRGTRAVPMLTGVGALAIAFYVAHLSNLRTLDWLVGTILPYSIFALIVIFQTAYSCRGLRSAWLQPHPHPRLAKWYRRCLRRHRHGGHDFFSGSDWCVGGD